MPHDTPCLPPPVHFSKRQLEIIRAWGECPDTALLAQQLGLSIHTVQTHLKRMRRKAGVKKTVEVWMYVKEGLKEDNIF